MKKFLTALVILIALVGVGLYVALSSLDSIVAGLIEDTGSDLTKTNVDVGGVKIELTNGSAAITDFSIANPKGFESDNAFSVASASVALDVGNSTPDLVVIKEVAIDNPKIAYEFGPNGSNFDVLKKALDDATGGGATSGDGGNAPKIIIENLYIRNGEVDVIAPGGLDAAANLQDIHLTGIGRKSGGATAAEVGEQVLAELMSKVNLSVGQLDPAKLQEMLGAAGIDSVAGGAISLIGRDGIGTTTDDAISDVEGAIKGLFGD